MPTIRRTFNGHDFTYGACVCGLTHEQYDDIGQPLCAGPRNAASMARATNGLAGTAPSGRPRFEPVGRDL